MPSADLLLPSLCSLRAGPPLRPDHSPLAALRRIEQALTAAVAAGEGPGGPPLLSAAIRHAVFPGGARIRPRLCLAVAQACGDDDPLLADAAAAAIELLHSASLVHDNLPCFEDAPTRRGMPSVHSRFGERIAVLTGDALIVLSFQIVAAAAGARPQRLAPVLAARARGVGTSAGIVAGQACEWAARFLRVACSTNRRGRYRFGPSSDSPRFGLPCSSSRKACPSSSFS